MVLAPKGPDKSAQGNALGTRKTAKNEGKSPEGAQQPTGGVSPLQGSVEGFATANPGVARGYFVAAPSGRTKYSATSKLAPARWRVRPPAGTWPLALLLPSRDRIDQTGPQALRHTRVTGRRGIFRVVGTARASGEARKEQRDAEDYRPPKSRVMHLPARGEAGRRLGEGGRGVPATHSGRPPPAVRPL